jgi:membrane-associated phospholipid phosphatase
MKYSQVVVFLLLVIYHSFILNPIEKKYSKQCFPHSNIIRRPSKKCRKVSVLHQNCLGLPSGSSEIITIITILLCHYQIISLPFSLFLILAVGMQRILLKKHTLLQVIAGIFIGFLYSSLYIYFHLSFLCLLFPILVTLPLVLFIRSQQVYMK